MNPIRQGDGTGLSVPGFSQVRKGDGTVLWSSGPDIPDSVVDNFEDSNATPSGPYQSSDTLADYYKGNLSDFTRTTSNTIEGQFSVEVSATNNKDQLIISEPGDGLPRYHKSGETIRVYLRAFNDGETGLLFNGSFDSGNNQISSYGVQLLQLDEFRIVRYDSAAPTDARDGSSRTILDDTNLQLTDNEIYWCEIDTADSNGNIECRIYETDNNLDRSTLVGTMSATDTSFVNNRGHGLIAPFETTKVGIDGIEIID